jgi:hypothetical protein
VAKTVPENLVLRTVYLPQALDARLRDRAFRLQVSNGEEICKLVEFALDRLEAGAPEPDPAQMSTAGAEARLRSE